MCAALAAYIEVTRDDPDVKNRLCPPNKLPNAPADWIRGTLTTLDVDRGWSKEPDIAAWLERSRLNPSRGLIGRAGEPDVGAAMGRFVTHVRAAATNLRAWSRPA